MPKSVRIKRNVLKSLFLFHLFFIGYCFSAEADFDPFGSNEDGTSVKVKNQDSGPVIPQIEFNNNDISMAFQIISDATGWSIFPTTEVSKAKISLWAKNTSAREVLDTIVKLAGFTYFEDGDMITVMTYEEYMQYHGLIKKVLKFDYADAASVDAVIKPFFTKLGKSVVHKETNTMVLYETQANLQFLIEVIEKLDQPSEQIVAEIIEIKYADCRELEKILKAAFANDSKEPKNKSLPGNDNEAKKKSDEIIISDSNLLNYPQENAGIFAITGSNQLLITGKKKDIEKIRKFIELIDVYGDNEILEVIDVKYADAEVMANTLKEVFSQKDNERITNKEENNPPQAAEGVLISPNASVGVYAIGRTNQVIIKAYRGDIDRIRELVEKLDIFVEPTTKNYHFVYVDASEVIKGLERILDIYGRYGRTRLGSSQGGGDNSSVTIVEKTNSILLTGPPSSHRIMSSIVESIDVVSSFESGMIRIYKIENADLDEVATTVKELLARQDNDRKADADIKVEDSVNSPGGTGETQEFTRQIEARVSVSKSTNSLVVQATTREHLELEKLIQQLDKRRKQVLIEAQIVEVTTTDDLSLGVELSHASEDASVFTAFGLSSNLDPVTGLRDITVSPGGTAAVLRPDKIAAIVQALKSNGRARITSAPKILVNDNAVGFINSIAEEPTVQTNQGETTTTTSFAGFVEAGTQFAITPHISEKDYLRVEYQITLNSFGTKPTDPSIPPPRNTSSIRSEATVPSGYTIVVGGLQTAEEIKNVDKIPLLGDIPIIGWLFKNTRIEKQYKTTYLFITPEIMESIDFEDLKNVSTEAAEQINEDAIRNYSQPQ